MEACGQLDRGHHFGGLADQGPAVPSRGCFNACREATGFMFVSVALAMIHDMDVGKIKRARLTAPAWERPGGLLGDGKGREWEQFSFRLAWVDCFDGNCCCIHFGG